MARVWCARQQRRKGHLAMSPSPPSVESATETTWSPLNYEKPALHNLSERAAKEQARLCVRSQAFRRFDASALRRFDASTLRSTPPFTRTPVQRVTPTPNYCCVWGELGNNLGFRSKYLLFTRAFGRLRGLVAHGMPLRPQREPRAAGAIASGGPCSTENQPAESAGFSILQFHASPHSDVENEHGDLD